MKLLFLLFVIAGISAFVYFVSLQITNGGKKHKKSGQKAIGITAILVIMLLAILAYGMYRSANAPDMQCGSVHTTASYPPANPTSAMDYFLLGNFDYDRGDCQKAITDYTTSIGLNPTYAQAYNNRAYTNMRMRFYKEALPDLDKAIVLNPNYLQALTNRADIHNYFFEIDRPNAIADYEKVISLGGTQETSVCGHLFLARHNGWHLATLFNIPRQLMGRCG